MCIGNEARGDPGEGDVQALVPFDGDCRILEFFDLTWKPRRCSNEIFLLLAASRDMSLGITSASVSTALASLVWYRWAAVRESEGNAATHQSLVSVLEHQLERCGPEKNHHCPPARDYCSWDHTFFAFLSGVCIGVLAGVGLVLCFCHLARITHFTTPLDPSKN